VKKLRQLIGKDAEQATKMAKAYLARTKLKERGEVADEVAMTGSKQIENRQDVVAQVEEFDLGDVVAALRRWLKEDYIARDKTSRLAKLSPEGLEQLKKKRLPVIKQFDGVFGAQ
jgi:hypothetical protein